MLQELTPSIRRDMAMASRFDWILETLFDMSIHEVQPRKYATTSTCSSATIRVNGQHAYLLIINCTDGALHNIHEKSRCFDDYGLGLDTAIDALQFLTNYTAERLGGFLTEKGSRYMASLYEESSDGILLDKHYESAGNGIHFILAEMMGVTS